jgi:hypothetical protein
MLRADTAEVDWNAEKKLWQVRVKLGEEVIKRPLPKTPHDAGEAELRALAVQTAKDDGYDVDPAKVAIVR